MVTTKLWSTVHDMIFPRMNLIINDRHVLLQVPQLFSGRYKVVTEMGRSLFLKAGTSLTRVEHVKVAAECAC